MLCSRVYVHRRLCEYTDRTVCLWNDCGALQPVRSGHLLLGRWRATGDMRHRVGTSRQLLSCWYDNRGRHELPRRQLLRRRSRKCGYVVGARRRAAAVGLQLLHVCNDKRGA